MASNRTQFSGQPRTRTRAQQPGRRGRPGRPEPTQPESNQTRPNQAHPNRAHPNQAHPDQADRARVVGAHLPTPSPHAVRYPHAPPPEAFFPTSSLTRSLTPTLTPTGPEPTGPEPTDPGGPVEVERAPLQLLLEAVAATPGLAADPQGRPLALFVPPASLRAHARRTARDLDGRFELAFPAAELATPAPLPAVGPATVVWWDPERLIPLTFIPELCLHCLAATVADGPAWAPSLVLSPHLGRAYVVAGRVELWCLAAARRAGLVTGPIPVPVALLSSSQDPDALALGDLHHPCDFLH